MTAALTAQPSLSGAVVSDRSARVAPEIYRRRRLVVVAIAAGLVLGTLSLGRHAGASRTVVPGSDATVTYVVQPGDTLWGIAGQLAPGADPRSVVDELDDLSGGVVLQPGQRLVIPVDVLR